VPRVTKQAPTGIKKTGLAGRIRPVKREDIGLKVNVYGRSGTGKTTFATTFPKKQLRIVCSSIGLGESRSIDPKTKGVDEVELLASEELNELEGLFTKYSTMILDHATGLQDLILKELLGLEELPLQKSWGMASREQWGQCAMQMKNRLRNLMRLSCHLVIIAQEREFNADGESEVIMPYVASALTPSVVGWLNPACDYIIHTYIRPAMEQKTVAGKTVQVKASGVEFCARLAPHDVYTTKFRTPRGKEVPEAIVDPTYDKIAKYI
jgi:hypothetical protein